MKSYLFTTEDDRGGVILCDIDTLEEVVPYLQQRFKGVVRVEQGRTEWTVDGGFAEFTPRPVSEIGLDAGTAGGKGETKSADLKPSSDDIVTTATSEQPDASAQAPAQVEQERGDETATGSLF